MTGAFTLPQLLPLKVFVTFPENLVLKGVIYVLLYSIC